VRHVPTQVRARTVVSSADKFGESFRQGDVEPLGQSFHDGAEGLEECDLRPIAHD